MYISTSAAVAQVKYDICDRRRKLTVAQMALNKKKCEYAS